MDQSKRKHKLDWEKENNELIVGQPCGHIDSCKEFPSLFACFHYFDL
jgi:hypothetical protein